MKRNRFRILLVCAAFVLIFAGGVAPAQEPPPQQLPANVAGKWTIYSKDPNGRTSSKYIDLQQNGTVLSGHFKGPYQSGGLQGTIDRQHIVFRTKTREPLTFRGRVDGNRVQGVVGEFQAVRPN